MTDGPITKPGEYAITAEVKITDSDGDEVTDNYSFPDPTGTLIVKLRVYVTVEEDEFIYDGEAHAAEFAVKIDGHTADKITFEPYVAKEAEKVTDVSVEPVKVEWTPVFKYEGEETAISSDYITGTPFAEAQLIIKPLPLEITVSPTASTNLTFNGKGQALVSSVSAKVTTAPENIPEELSETVAAIAENVTLTAERGG